MDGTPWTAHEVDLILADYFDMLRAELAGQAYVKSQHNAGLRQRVDRSRGSVERKHQNISAVLERLGLPWIRGYKPLANFQKSLVDAVDRFLIAHPDLDTTLPPARSAVFAESGSLFIEPPPVLAADHRNSAEAVLEPLIRKFDPAERDRRNRELGWAGEELVFEHERALLFNSGRADLSQQVRWVSKELGDGAGYDIESFDLAGRPRLIEVKTTRGGKRTPFYLSENERRVSESRLDEFRLVRLFEFGQATKGFELRPPLINSVLLQPTGYKASFL